MTYLYQKSGWGSKHGVWTDIESEETCSEAISNQAILLPISKVSKSNILRRSCDARDLVGTFEYKSIIQTTLLDGDPWHDSPDIRINIIVDCGV
jgi:hypothetical protein